LTEIRQPDQSEINQEEAEAYKPTDIPVRIEGPADVRILPAVAWFPARFEVTDTTGPVRLVGRNQFRKRLLMHSQTAGFYYGSAQAQVQGRGNCPFIVKDVPIELTHTEEIWANNIAGELPVISIIEEMWTN
jgi:hypothetical protein